MTTELELSYSHQTKHQILKKCTLCNKANMLMRLPEEFQEHAAKKDFESWFCCNCLQVVNFCI